MIDKRCLLIEEAQEVPPRALTVRVSVWDRQYVPTVSWLHTVLPLQEALIPGGN